MATLKDDGDTKTVLAEAGLALLPSAADSNGNGMQAHAPAFAVANGNGLGGVVMPVPATPVAAPASMTVQISPR